MPVADMLRSPGRPYLIEQRQRGRPDCARQCVKPVHAIQAADVADRPLTVAVSLLDSVAQPPELVGLADHPAARFVALLLVGLVRAHRLGGVGNPARRPL